MIASLTSLLLCGMLAQNAGDMAKNYDAGYLCQPAYALDDVIRGPVKKYVPQPGDIYMSTDKSWIINAGHRLAWSGQPNHSGIVFCLEDETPAILEAGPFNGLKIEIVDLRNDFGRHEERKEKVWIRARKTPLTKEQCHELTQWATRHHGRPFAARRMLRQMTPFRTRGPLRTFFMGEPNGERDRYFCAELVMETCVHLGLVDRTIARPSATYPEDLFFDRSRNIFLSRYFTLADGWHPPARWVAAQPAAERAGQ